MPFINYRHKKFRMLKGELDEREWKLEVQTNFNVDPSTSKTTTTYIPVSSPGFVKAILVWVKMDQKFAGMTMDDFIDSLLTPEEIAELDGMPIATHSCHEISDK